MALSNEDILSWFCATNPLPEISTDTIEILPTPGHTRYGHQFREPSKPLSNGVDITQRGSTSDSVTSPTSPLAVEGSHYQRLASLQKSLDDCHDEHPCFDFAGIEDLDADDLIPEAMPESDATAETLYATYSFDQNNNPHLPIAQHREKVISTIEANQVTIIQGATGSGKSTQVPQYVLEHYASEGRHCNIVCTQPRRIATTSVAKFVAESRGWPVGSLVGYQIHLDRAVSEDTRLAFMTTGLLQEKLVGMKNMNQYTHVILDEVHERDKETDFLLLLVRKLLRTNSRHVKVILMSATLDSELFARYFAVRISGRLELAPIVQVEGRSYRVTEFYLDDIKHIGECGKMDAENPRINEDAKELACKLIAYFDTIEASESSEDSVRGTVLVFLPGMPEIKDLDEKLRDGAHTLGLRLNTLPLHSTISPDEQYRVFLRPEAGRRKVILATNIAESSITVPDIKYVIDFCLVKESICDPETNYQRLPTRWASKASLNQRKGRAGRVSEGRCYRLITREFYRRNTPEYSTPEMLRTSLEKLVLKAKKLQDLGEPRAILSLALDPPNLAGIERAVIHLKEVGALTVTQRGVINPYDGDMTFMGRVLEELPVDVKVGKLLLLGHAFGYLEECMVIAASLSNRSFFTKPYMEEMRGYMSKMEWASLSFSDCIATLEAYKNWFSMKQSGNFRSSGKAESQWCHRNLIHKGAINAAADLVRDLEARLSRFNIKSSRNLLTRYNESPHDILILKLVICGAFYPNYFRWGMADEEINQREMSGHDPTSTIMLSGLPPNPERYASAICNMFKWPGKMGGKFLHFEGQKVFIEFGRERSSRSKETMSTVPVVLQEVYAALKRRYLRKPLELYINDEPVHYSSMRDREETESIFSEDPDRELKPVNLPKFGCHQIMVTEIVDAGHFWAQFGDMETVEKLQSLMESIGKRVPTPVSYCKPQELVGRFCLAKFSEDKNYYRAKVLDIHPFVQRDTFGQPVSILLAEVIFVDYGNAEHVSLDDLCELTRKEREQPMLAFECFLTSVKPSYEHSPEGQWSTEAIFRFRELCGEKYLIADVFSEVNGVLRVALYDTTGQDDILINRVLVEEGFATKTSEPYSSKLANTQAIVAEKAAQLRREKEKIERAERKERGEEEGREERRGRPLQSSNCTTVEWSDTLDFESRCQLGRERYPRGRTTRVTLKGPNNPYEVNFYAMTSVGCTRPARIERDSVNSIVIDNEPWDKHERLMVAAFVSLNPSASSTLARDTTLLPNIHGLPYLVCLLFAPAVEMRTDELKRQYTGAICGLGFDPNTGESLYPEQDIELTFDTLITQEDLYLVNRIRSAVSLALTEDAKNSIAEWGRTAVKNLQDKARDYLTELILKPRESVPPFQFIGQGWNQVPPDDILVARMPVEAELEDVTSPPVYQLHNGIAISGERIDQQRATRVLLLREKMKELHRKAAKSMQPEVLVCELCNVRCSNRRELLAHIQGRVHRAEESKLFQDDLELDLTEKQLEQMHL